MKRNKASPSTPTKLSFVLLAFVLIAACQALDQRDASFTSTSAVDGTTEKFPLGAMPGITLVPGTSTRAEVRQLIVAVKLLDPALVTNPELVDPNCDTFFDSSDLRLIHFLHVRYNDTGLLKTITHDNKSVCLLPGINPPTPEESGLDAITIGESDVDDVLRLAMSHISLDDTIPGAFNGLCYSYIYNEMVDVKKAQIEFTNSGIVYSIDEDEDDACVIY